MVFSYLLFAAARMAQSDGFMLHVTNFSAVDALKTRQSSF